MASESTTQNGLLCELEVTVCTGFEMTAKEEIEEKLSSAYNVTAARGRVNMLVPVDEAKNVRRIIRCHGCYLTQNYINLL